MPDGAIAGLDGTLIAPRAASDWLCAQTDAVPAIAAAMAQWAAGAAATLGPAATERRMLECLEALLACELGFRCRAGGGHAIAQAPSGDVLALVAFGWRRPLTLASRAVVRFAMDAGAEFAIGFNGVSLGIVDARPAAPRRIALIAIDQLASRGATAAFAAALLHAPAFARGSIGGAVRWSDTSSREQTTELRQGVHRSLEALACALPFDAAVTVLFRILFVLFAEARSLVPVWHRVYRRHYSLAALAARPAREARGMWAALEAGRRLLGSGCDAGTLRVTGFNGPLFAPPSTRKWAGSALLESRFDAPASAALASLVAYRPARGGARQVSYAELDVEELGSVYERVLDLDPAGDGGVRKETGSYYTPRALTEFIVRRTLAPLTCDAASARILALRVVDPAMGSGAFLVAALRYLAAALEEALVREGALPAHDVTSRDRQHLRRLVAQRCLYGVDVNPTATMLAKLSVWLATMSGDKPLGFLDHRLKCGNSLAGIDPYRARRPPGAAPRERPLPLFDEEACAASLRAGAEGAACLSEMPEETLADLRRKQQRFASIDAGSIESWRTLCDAWCAWWFMPARDRPDAREYRALADALVRHARLLPRRNAGRRLRAVAAIRSTERFFHWPLEFPDVFGGGPPDGAAGFDAVIGNPPWEMLRAVSGARGRETFKAFIRGSGIFRAGARGHVNLYQLFVERFLHLVRHGGRIGMVMPWGLMTDDGSAPLRGRLLDGTRIDTLVRLDNAAGLFQAHRGLRFAAVTAGVGRATDALPLARVSGGAGRLDDEPDAGPLGGAVILPRAALERLGGPARRVPDVADDRALALAIRLAAGHRALGDAAGWGARFGRELNLTDDRAAFGRSGLPVLEGKHVHPNRIDLGAGCHRITRSAAARLLPDRPFDRDRLAYRDVTAVTNRHTVIAAIVPAGMVTSHSLFCLRNPWDPRTQQALCLILNSRIANFLIRLFVASHLTTSLMEWLPVPDRARAVAALGGARARRQWRVGREGIEAIVAELYGLTEAERAAI